MHASRAGTARARRVGRTPHLAAAVQLKHIKVPREHELQVAPQLFAHAQPPAVRSRRSEERLLRHDRQALRSRMPTSEGPSIAHKDDSQAQHIALTRSATFLS